MSSTRRFLKHAPCPKCGSSDALSLYSDGYEVCYSDGCGYYSYSSNNNSHRKKTVRKKPMIEGDILAIPSRGLTKDTCEFFSYKIGLVNDQPVHIAPYTYKGTVVAQKLRFPDKTFQFIGDGSNVELFGQNKTKAGGKCLVITEGEIDAMSVYQACKGLPISAVSIPKGISGAEKAIRENITFIDSFEKVVLMFDSEDAAQEMARKCAAIIGPSKAFIAELPLKDANEMLKAGRSDELKWAPYNAKEFKIEGVQSLAEYDPEEITDTENCSIDVMFPKLNEKFQGFERGGIYTIAAREKSGKGLALDTKVPTPNGWTTMGQLAKGDQVFGADGKPVNVSWVSEIHNIDCYEFTFTCGTKVIADKSHLWKVRESHSTEYTVLSTEELLAKGITTAKGRNKWSVEMAGAVEYPEADLPIDPYWLGYWLGDGHASSANITVGQQDVEEVTANLHPEEVVQKSGAYCLRFYNCNKYSSTDSRRAQLKELGVLQNKHVPAPYMTSSPKQRLALLQGLLDSDGYVSKEGRGEFTSTNKALALAVKELLFSFGIKASMIEHESKLYGKACGPRYRVNFIPTADCFRLTRKRERCKAKSVYNKVRKISSVVPVKSVPTVCIGVDSEDKTFLVTEQYLVTHNSLLCREMALDWAKKGLKVGVLFLEEKPIDAPRHFLAMEMHMPIKEFKTKGHELKNSSSKILKEPWAKNIIVYDHGGSLTVESVRVVLKYFITAGCDIVILDNLSIVLAQDGDTLGSTNQLVAELVALVNSSNAVLLNVVHLKKNRTDSDGNERTAVSAADVYGTGAFAKFSYGLIAIEREENRTKLNVLRNRDTGFEGYVDTLKYDPTTGRLSLTTNPESSKLFL